VSLLTFVTNDGILHTNIIPVKGTFSPACLDLQSKKQHRRGTSFGCSDTNAKCPVRL